MKLKADRAALLKALAHVQSVVERRNTIPILANVMIAVRDGSHCSFTAPTFPLLARVCNVSASGVSAARACAAMSKQTRKIFPANEANEVFMR